MSTIQPVDLKNLEDERCRAMTGADSKQALLAKIESGATQ
jgi:hypothetical protein